MKKRLIFLSLTLFLGLVCQSAYATPLLEETGFIQGSGSEQFQFIADQTPLLHEVTLTDLDYEELFFFESFSVTVATLSAEVAALSEPGMTTFNATFGMTYYASIKGDAGGVSDTGLFGLLIEAVATPIPEPASLLLFTTGLVGIVGSRLKRKDRPSLRASFYP